MLRMIQYVRNRRWGFLLIGFISLMSMVVSEPVKGQDDDDHDNDDLGMVFTLTNEPTGNRLAMFFVDEAGELSQPLFYGTGGNGATSGLGSQGAIALSSNRQYLFAVNAGSNSISVFRLSPVGPDFLYSTNSGGMHPISLTVHRNLLYVLNAGGGMTGGTDTINGFRIGSNGSLTSLKTSANLSVANSGPAQIGFNSEGDVLTVTEKGTNSISLFPVKSSGELGTRITVKSSGQTPFGFAYASDDLLVVSEAAGGAANASTVSSYELDPFQLLLHSLTPSIPTNQSAACWIAITANNKYAYASNTGSATITGFHIRSHGTLQLLESSGDTATTAATPADMAILADNLLFVLDGSVGTVGAYHIGHDGSLTSTSTVKGLPLTHPAGMVVR